MSGGVLIQDIPAKWYRRFPIGTKMGGWLILAIEREPKYNKIYIRVRCTGCNDVEALRAPGQLESDVGNWCRPCAAQRRLARDGSFDTQRRPDPTPEEIKAITAEIRKEWSEAEHRKRAGLRRTVNIPCVGGIR